MPTGVAFPLRARMSKPGRFGSSSCLRSGCVSDADKVFWRTSAPNAYLAAGPGGRLSSRSLQSRDDHGDGKVVESVVSVERQASRSTGLTGRTRKSAPRPDEYALEASHARPVECIRAKWPHPRPPRGRSFLVARRVVSPSTPPTELSALPPAPLPVLPGVRGSSPLARKRARAPAKLPCRDGAAPAPTPPARAARAPGGNQHNPTMP